MNVVMGRCLSGNPGKYLAANRRGYQGVQTGDDSLNCNKGAQLTAEGTV